MTTWISTITNTSSATTVLPGLVITNGYGGAGSNYSAGGGYVTWVPAPSAPKALTAREWLDAEVERTCALARAAA